MPTIRLSNGAPIQLALPASPSVSRPRVNHDLGLYVSDKWTVKRLTMNLGLRFDWLNAEITAQDAPPGHYLPARHFDRIPDVPNWNDLNPRLGVAYDVFGNGKTAIKASVNRYVAADGTGFSGSFNPMTASATDTRNVVSTNGSPKVTS